jgi:hypothetical protein
VVMDGMGDHGLSKKNGRLPHAARMAFFDHLISNP